MELPPLARGREWSHLVSSAGQGITPARAGKSCPVGEGQVGVGNYPRSRGEERAATMTSAASMELPPLARGRVLVSPTPRLKQGITPARAGKSHPRDSRARRGGNYPRSRGEEPKNRPEVSSPPELPPLARGRETAAGQRILPLGITPARAGKSAQLLERVALKRNYPRSRGEEIRVMLPMRPSKELPPLARGRVTTCPRHRRTRGITPARAGKRTRHRGQTPHGGNYPRSRGEELPLLALARGQWELPPLARGRASASSNDSMPPGITPARAGKRPSHLWFY